MKNGNDGSFRPNHDYDFRLDLPDRRAGRLRLLPLGIFVWKNDEVYYGISENTDSKEVYNDLREDSRYYHYTLFNPRAALNAHIKLIDHYSAMIGIQLNHVRATPRAGGKLAEDIASADRGDMKLYGTDAVTFLQLAYGFLFDTRDHETTPTKGMYHELSGRMVPGIGVNKIPTLWGGAHCTARFFLPLYRRYLVAAWRCIVDLQWGDVPFYEQIAAGTFITSGLPGGGYGVRGIPFGLYGGKFKLASSGELRSMFAELTLLRQHFLFGAALFFDAAMVQKDFFKLNTGRRLRYGAGGGLRLRWGETVLLRFDVAYAPEAFDIFGSPGIYLELGEAF